MYTLYYSPGAASLAVHWTLIELNVPHELVLTDIEKKEQKTPEYLKLNPSGMVPTLIVDGAPRTECAALLLLLAERHPERGLAPPLGSSARAEYLQWTMFIANTLQPAFRAWFYPHEPAGEANAEAAKAQARRNIESIWQRVDALLANREFIIADALTTADFLTTMLMRWSRNMPKPATAWPNIKSYAQRMCALPSFAKVRAAEKMQDWIF